MYTMYFFTDVLLNPKRRLNPGYCKDQRNAAVIILRHNGLLVIWLVICSLGLRFVSYLLSPFFQIAIAIRENKLCKTMEQFA